MNNPVLDFEIDLRLFINVMELVDEKQSDILFDVNTKSYYQEGNYVFKDFSGNVLSLETHESNKKDVDTDYEIKSMKYNGFTLEEENYPFLTDKAIELIGEGI